MPPASPAISVQGLSKRYGAKEAVRDVSFDVGAGEIFGLIGPNGAGKTTTLEMILGLTAPDGGTITVDRPKLGAQLQSSSLPDAMTPRQALKLCGAFYPARAAPEELIERFQLTEKADARYSSLSGGQRQRLALALAFVNRPNVVVLDEPTVGLDVPARNELHALIRAERAAGRTIVFTTHYLEEARGLCDRVALINDGRVVALDTPHRLIAASRLTPRLLFRTAPRLDKRLLAALPGVTSIAPASQASVTGERDLDTRGDVSKPPRPEALAAALAGNDPAGRESLFNSNPPSHDLASETNPNAAWVIETADVPKTLAALAMLAEASQAELLDLQVVRPTLDDAFLKLTA